MLASTSTRHSGGSIKSSAEVSTGSPWPPPPAAAEVSTAEFTGRRSLAKSCFFLYR